MENPATQSDPAQAIAAVARALSGGSELQPEVLLRLAREWSGGSHAFMTVFGSDAPQIRARSAGTPGQEPASLLLDPALELALRAGTIVRHPEEQAAAMAVPLYGGGEVAGALEVTAGTAGRLRAEALPALQVLAGILASTLSPSDLATAPRIRALGSRYPSLHDPLTGLPGRALLFDRMHQAIQLARREEAPLAVFLIRITYFNDLAQDLGAEAMQTVVQEFARRIRATLRASDTVARPDQEHIAVLLPGANAIGALGTVKKVLRAVGAPMPLAGQHVSLQANAGIAVFPDQGDDADTLLTHAGEALLRAREEGQPSAIHGE